MFYIIIVRHSVYSGTSDTTLTFGGSRLNISFWIFY